MVRIIDCKLSENADGKEFVSLKIQSGVEMIQSQQTGRFYLTAKSCYIPSTFDLSSAEALIGSELPGKVARVDSEPYEYRVKETGDVPTLNHRYEYRPDDAPAAFSLPSAKKALLDIAE
jgi:hypothetical protein